MRVRTAVGALLLSLSSLAAQESAGRIYQEAFFLEQGRGDLESAIDLYEKLVREFPANKTLAARSLLRLGICYEILGQEKAAVAYQTILDEYSDQPEIVVQARRKLDQLLRKQKRIEEEQSPPSMQLRELTLKEGELIYDPDASLSRDGIHLVYEEMVRPYPLVVSDLSSGTRSVVRASNLPAESRAVRYRWSHDGTRLAYQVRDALSSSIWLYNLADARSSRWVGPLQGRFRLLDWGPEDDSILGRVWTASGDPELVIYGSDGAVQARLRDPGCGKVRVQPGKGSAVCSSEEEKPQILLFSLQASDRPQVLAAHPGADRHPIWSADGRHVAFLSDRDETGNWDLWAVRMDEASRAGQPFLLFRDVGGNVRLDSWSRDGQLSFRKDNRVRDIWAVPVDSDTATVSGDAFVTTVRQGGNFQPAASPTGERVAFMASDADNNWLLGVGGVGESEEELIPLEAESLYNPVWRDETRIVLTARDETGGFFLEYDTSSRTVRRLMDGPEYQWMTGSEGWLFPARPDYSADGRTLIFRYTAGDDDVSKSELFTFDGTELARIEGTTGCVIPRWSPDGHSIAFLNSQRKALEMAAADGTSRRTLVTLSRGKIGTFNWSPDGRFLVYPRFDEEAISEGDYWTVWIVPADGKEHRQLPTPRGLNPWWVDWTGDGRHLILGSLRILPSHFVLEHFWPRDLD